MAFFNDEIIQLLSPSNSSMNLTETENATTTFFVELSCTGTSIIFSAIGIYLNLVLARSLFKSTLLTTSHRRTIRFFSYVHICLGVFVVVTSVTWLFRSFTWRIVPLPTIMFIAVRDACRASLVWCCLERMVYNQNEKIREDRVGKLLIFIRVGVVSLTMISTGVFTLVICNVDPDFLIPHPAFLLQLIVLSLVPIPMIIILLLMISRIAKRQTLSHGLVAVVRSKKLELERAAMRNCLLPLTLFLSIFSGMEILVYYFADYLYAPLTFVLYSARVMIFPLSHMVMQPLLREDCRLNLFIWRKLQRRSSEARVRTIMNKESQDSIISNFKMIGILSE